MSPSILKQPVEVTSNVAFPFITIALEIDAMNTSKEQIEQKIKLVIERVENELESIDGIPGYIASPAADRVKRILTTLENNANKKSIVIFLAPFVEKVYYLNFPIKENVTVGEPFHLRELIYTKKEEVKYLVLSLHSDKCYMYAGEGESLSLIVFNSVEHLKSRCCGGKEKFLSHVDNVLTHILKSYGVPLIAVGAEPILSLFASVAKNSIEITQAIYCKTEEENVASIQQLIKPSIREWEKLKETNLLRKLDGAIKQKRAEIGIHKVCKAAKDKRGKLLIVEKDFYYSYRSNNTNETISPQAVSANGDLGIDAVEDVIEQVLTAGGNIEFVTPGVLSDYMHVALVV